MELADSCQSAEAGLKALLADLSLPDPSRLENSEAELNAIVRSLGVWVSASRPASSKDRAALLRLQRTTRQLKTQIEFGLRLCSGWAQIYSNSGYTRQGQPEMTEAESKAVYEA